MRIGLVSTRLAGVDGVSFETAKWETVLGGMGHETERCAGELAPLPGGRLIPEMHFPSPTGGGGDAGGVRPPIGPGRRATRGRTPQ